MFIFVDIDALGCDIMKMPTLFDAPLSLQGKHQCERLAKVADVLFRDSPPPVIFCSPLTRAIQTAVIGFQSYVDKTQLVLMPSAREKYVQVFSTCVFVVEIVCVCYLVNSTAYHRYTARVYIVWTIREIPGSYGCVLFLAGCATL